MAIWNLVPLSCLLLVWSPEVYGDAHRAATTLIEVRNAAALNKLLRDVSIGKSFLVIDLFARGGFHAADATAGATLSPLCENHTSLYLTALQNSEGWAISMFDASTKIPEGLLAGSMTHLGNFDECIDIRDVQTDDGVFHGQHCLASLSVDPSTRGPDSSRLQEVLDRTGGSGALLMAANIKMAVCVPSSCSPNDTALFTKRSLDNLVAQLNFPMQFNVEVSDLECHTTDQPEFKSEDWVAVVILILFGVLVVLSTTYDVLQQNAESRSNLLLAFSVYTNGKKLLATSSTGDTLHAVHGIRFLSIAWVMLAHRYIAAGRMPSINQLTFATDFLTDWKRLAITNGTLAVDTFFVLSGLLVSYVFFKQVPRMKSFNIPMYYIHRYIRLTPAFAIMIMLEATLFNYAGSGPLWESSTVGQKEICQDNWWTGLLYVHNYVDPLRMCVGQSWYLAVDMQLHWLSPIVLVPLWKWPKIGAGIMGVLTIGGLISNYLISYNNGYYGDFITSTRTPDMVDYMKNIYFPAYARFVPYLIGIGLGYLLVNLKTKGIQPHISKLLTLVLWLAGGGCMLLSLCIVHNFHQPDYVIDLVESAFYNSLGRPVWSLGVAIVIFLCSTGHGCFANTLLSWEWWQPLSRLSYSLYLVHMDVQLSQQGSARTLSYLSDINTIPQFCGDLLISIFFAAILSLVFESPFIILEKELLGRRKPPQRPKTVLKGATSELEKGIPDVITDGENASQNSKSTVNNATPELEEGIPDVIIDEENAPDNSKPTVYNATPEQEKSFSQDKNSAQGEI